MAVHLNSVELTQHIGHTQYNDWIHSTFLDANLSFGKKTTVQVRLPAYTIILGQMPISKGWGDLFLNVSQKVVVNDAYQINLTVGAKIYTSRADKQTSDGKPMPMYQQTSYGSNDLNAGFSLMTRKWQLAMGYQHALNKIGNNFTLQNWIGSPLYNTVQRYDQSAGLERGNDLMLRVERNFRLSRFNFYLSILNLWRVTADKTLDENGNLQEVKGSKGLAINFVTGGGYQFNTRMGIRLLVSVKLKERDANPDGLSRNFIGQLAYIVRF